jgi:hypothetical protein
MEAAIPIPRQLSSWRKILAVLYILSEPSVSGTAVSFLIENAASPRLRKWTCRVVAIDGSGRSIALSMRSEGCHPAIWLILVK